MVGASPFPEGEGGFLVNLCAFLSADGIFFELPSARISLGEGYW